MRSGSGVFTFDEVDMNGLVGKRRRHRVPKLTPMEAVGVRVMRTLGYSYKEIMKVFNVSRDTLRRAITGTGAYQGVK